MSVNVKQSTMVRPFKETIPRQSIWLSSLDLVGRSPYTHSNLLYVYHPTNTKTSLYFLETNLLRNALSRVLVPFYPAAGRLRCNENDGGRLEIDCNDEGVLFVEAETSISLGDLGDFKPDYSELKKLHPQCDYSKGLSSFPLVMVQLTRFRCGGVTLGLATHHHLGDGGTFVHFMNSWSRLARGLDIKVMPIHERRLYLSPRDPPQVKFQHFIPNPVGLPGDSPLLEYLKTMPTTVVLFKLSKDQISILKQRAASQHKNYEPTTYEVLAAHIWRSVCKAQQHNDEQEMILYMPTNVRRRRWGKTSLLPPGFCGNGFFLPACIMKAGDIESSSLGYVAKKINEALRLMEDDEYLMSMIDFYEAQPKLRTIVRGIPPFRYPNISVNFWGKGMSLYEADFGWGKPMFVGHGGLKFEGQSFVVPNKNGDGGCSVSINLFTHHMALFREYFSDLYNLFSRM